MMRSATGVGLLALTAGLLAQYLFVDSALGINVPIAAAALLLAGWVVRDRSKSPRLVDTWLAPAALILSAFVALRGDGTLVTLDVLGALLLAGAALVSFGGLRVMERPVAGVVALAGRLALAGLAAAGPPLAALTRSLPKGRRLRDSSLAPVVRGLLIAAPLVILFALLFASADAVFARIAGDLLDWNLDLGSVPVRLAVVALVAWLVAGLLGFAAAAEDRPPSAAAVTRWQARPRLGSTEALTVLAALDLLFIGFVVLQGAYLFGGRDTLQASGLTYAEYARRGFFELLAVAFVVGGIILAMEAFVRARTRGYLAAAIGLVVLTIVILASAFLRLRLYQDAYGWTELRFYVLAAIIWLALGAMMAVATLATDHTRWLLHGLLVLSVAFGLGFNLIGPVRLVAEQNVQRAIHPELVAPGGETGFDIYYLASLGDDALPLLAEHRCDLRLSVATIKALDMRINVLADDEGGRVWQAWNLSRERAKDLRFEAICLLSAG